MNGDGNEFPSSRPAEDSPDEAHTLVDHVAAPASIDQPLSDGLECQRAEFGHRRATVESRKMSDHRPVVVDRARRCAVRLAVVALRVFEEPGAQLDDGRELMFFRLRRSDGSSTWVDGTLIEADGSSRALVTQGVEFTRRDSWTSPETGITYPAGFRLKLPAEDLSLEVVPLLLGQELRLSFVYWEGVVSISFSGSGSGSGRGYLEMTGYGERASLR